MLHDHSGFSGSQPATPSPTIAHETQSQTDLVVRHSAMVRQIAWGVFRRASSGVELQDLIQIGLLALIECAADYQDRGFLFSTYASTRVRGAMLDYLRKLAPLSRSAMANRRVLFATRAKLQQAYMRPPTAQEMAEAMGISVREYHHQIGRILPIEGESIDAIYSDHDHRFTDVKPAADVVLETEQTCDILHHSLAQLPERDATILRLIFVEEWNLEKIGQTLGIGAARVCQIKKSALQKLRCELEPVL